MITIIGQKISEYRKEKGLSQKELADISNINRMSIGNYERGTRTPNAEILQSIATALGVTINDLLGTSDKYNYDFNIEEFDSISKKYITHINNTLMTSAPGTNISNTVILQNLIIKQKAERDAQNFVKLDRSVIPSEFDIDENGDLITGKVLYQSLYEYYKEEFLREKLRILEERFQYIAEYEDEALRIAREYYSNIPKKMIPDYILRKLYPEYLYKELREDTSRRKFLKKIADFAKMSAKKEELDEYTIDLINEYYEVFGADDPGILEKYLKK